MTLSKKQGDKSIYGEIKKAGRKRKSSTIPFGFKLSDDAPGLIEPIDDELAALDKALHYVSMGCSIKEVARWVQGSTGRYISDKGLKFIFDRERG